MNSPRFLLCARIGPDSLHEHWLEGRGRAFDVLLSSYDMAPPPCAGDGVIVEHRPGRKVQGYAAMIRERRALLAQYDYVALFDDDLLIGGEAIAQLFAIAAAHGVKIAQPALDPASFYTYACLLRHAGFRLRYVNYVEMMCPVFRSDVLLDLLPLFELGYESGLDLVWCNLVAESTRDFAVIDAVSVLHTRRVGRNKRLNGFADGRRYEDDIHAILARFGLPWLPCLPYGAIRSDGKERRGQRGSWPAALWLAIAVPRQHPVRMRARNLAVYWKHLLTASARNVRVPPAPRDGPTSG